MFIILECNPLITLTSTDRETNSKGKIVYQRWLVEEKLSLFTKLQKLILTLPLPIPDEEKKLTYFFSNFFVVFQKVL